MSSAYKNINHVAGQSFTSECGCGSGVVREGFHEGMDYGMGRDCQFPMPPPKRCYCQAAHFSSRDGRQYHLMANAYGHSTPCK